MVAVDSAHVLWCYWIWGVTVGHLRMKKKKPTFMSLSHWKGRIRKVMGGREGGGRDRNGVSSMLWFVWGQWKAQSRQTVRLYGFC